MKYLNKLFLLSLLVFTFASCDKEGEDDDNGSDPIMTEATTEEKITLDAGWTITAIEANYDDVVDEFNDNITEPTFESQLALGILGAIGPDIQTVSACEMDDVVKFMDAGVIQYDEGSDLCNANTNISQNTIFFEDGTWSLKDANTFTVTIVFDGETEVIDYNIETLTDTELVLASSVDGNIATGIATSVYQATNNLDTKITMVKAN